MQTAPGSTLEKVTASGVELDTSSAAFGTLRDSSDVSGDALALRQRLDEDGYLFLPGLLHRDEVLEARAVVARRLAERGMLHPGSDPMECRVALEAAERPIPSMELALNNPQLMKVLYEGPMMEWYEMFLGGPVRHFDYTWFRAVAPGTSTPPHTDAVYMNRGTHNLYTSWTPMGDIPRAMGGLMMLEGSHKIERLRQNYSMKDVDDFCENRVGSNYTEMGGGGNIRKYGNLSENPFKLRQALGGRWLTSDFRAGDLLMFSIFTVHASIDNASDQIRLSSDSRYQLASESADERWIGANPIGHGPSAKRAMIC